MRPVFLLLLAAACTEKKAEAIVPAPPSDEVTARSRDQMSTYVAISVATPERPEVLAAIEAAFAEIERLQLFLSEWRDDSEISRINSEAGKPQPVVVSKELFDTIKAAHDVSVATNGAFDITFAGLDGLWDFKSLTPIVPTDDAIAERLPLIDYRHVVLDPTKRSVRLGKEKVRMGVGGIAKGTTVDSASAVLTKLGYPNHLVVAGGDLYASGRKATKRWKIGVRAPDGQGLYATLEVENEGVATSGNYERYFVKDGVRYHHILDPKTGKPARGLSSVTVIAPSAMSADAYSTALFVLGPKAGLTVAKENPRLEALLFDDKFVVTSTDSIRSRLQVVEVNDTAGAKPE